MRIVIAVEGGDGIEVFIYDLTVSAWHTNISIEWSVVLEILRILARISIRPQKLHQFIIIHIYPFR